MPAPKSYIISKRSDYPFLARLTSLRALVSNKNLRKLQATQKSLQKMFSILFSFLALTLPKQLKIQKKPYFFDHFIVKRKRVVSGGVTLLRSVRKLNDVVPGIGPIHCVKLFVNLKEYFLGYLKLIRS